MSVYIDGRLANSKSYNLTYVGRYGPIRTGVDNLPNQAESAITRLQVWDCNSNWIGQVDSPTVYYVA